MQPLKKIEVEDWFQRNIRNYEAARYMLVKDRLRDGTSFYDSIHKGNDEINKIDPIFLRAYGVQYNNERSDGV